jgi:LacI family transcriptional regulator/LacI family repressor for deo operon, udp, cdd, tsx, nupC, and nupG
VPEDLAVIGFDDLDVAEVLGLTTVRQPLRDTGLRGADLLLEALRGRPPTTTEVRVPLTVVARRTT